ncbi:MAG: hypothetical protein HYV09_28610 [Deltaproteobacteria bacterium]|nr:hypothetical protein [Deltaproteobacteria bacterium]
MKNEASSGWFEALRARCSSCGEAIARHPYCASCGRPRRCGDDAQWRHDPRGRLSCPDCVVEAS